MWNFQYKHGDRPLEGYTIQRGAGRGGFGEVYYAISDSGREVALKAITTYEQIELRGISQCMNLKNPHLVSIFDVKYNDQGKPFVIMEFVSGPSLRQLIDESPSGLGTQKAAFFLREIGKGLTYLHDNGIVHRDLKPANIFYENGYVKIGDYGLSKAIANTHTSAQTITVGTVHYMAPEVGAGKYDRSIDIYALGAVLYEMLTGMVPFTGASPSEVLIKHLGSEPDTKGIEEPFATVIRKAMAKNPNDRYQSVQEMVEGVFGSEHVRQSVSVFSPDQLSVVAAYTAQRAQQTAEAVGSGGSGSSAQSTDRATAVAQKFMHVADRVANFSERMVDMGVRAAGAYGAARNPNVANGISSRAMDVTPPAVADPMTRGQRLFIAIIASLLAGTVAGCLTHERFIEPVAVFLFVFTASMGGALGIVLAVRKLTPQIHGESETIHRIAVGGLASLLAALLSVPMWGPGAVSRDPAGLWLPILVPLFFMNAAAWTKPDREERVTFWDTAFLAGLFAFIISQIFDSGSWTPIVTVAAIAVVTQILSAFDPKANRPGKKIAKAWKTISNQAFTGVNAAAAATAAAAGPTSRKAGWYEYRARRRIEREQWRQMRREQRALYRREHRGSLLSLPAFVFIVVACAVSLAMALRFVDALHAGLPDPSVRYQLERDIFNGYPDWDRLLLKLGAFLTVVTTMLAVTTTTLARRRRGPLHILRGVFGVLLLIGAMFSIGGAFRFGSWDEIARFVHQNQPAPAIATFLNGFNGVIILSAVMFVVAIIMIAWTPRREPSPFDEHYAASAPTAPPQSTAPASTQPKTEGAAAP